MWRVQGFVGRVLHRYHGSNSLRLPQSQGQPQGLGEVEIINSSPVLSTPPRPSDGSSQKEEDEKRRKKQRTFRLGFAEVPHYTALDAVGWGAAAVLFMQICRRIHSQFSTTSEPSLNPGALTAPSTLHKCGYRILLDNLSRRDVLPGGRRVMCLQEGQEIQNQDRVQSRSGSSGDSSLQGTSEPPSDPIPEEFFLSDSCPLQNDADRDSTETNDKDMPSDEQRLTGAALNLRHVGDRCIPLVLNIIGLESTKRENYKEAFPCFLAAAQQGYSKAQFNTGVCYETGRGVVKDRDEALYYYRQAAVGGHHQAQYRYAKLLLTGKGHQSKEELSTAIHFLEQAAAAGLSKAQVCLASVYTRQSVRDGSRTVHYLKMAAGSGDDTALLFLGQCFERGFVVRQNLTTAVEYYKRAAQAGNEQAKSLLTPLNDPLNKEESVLRSIRSAPCFPAADRQLKRPLSSQAHRVPPSSCRPFALPLLSHSWSTGSLCVSPPVSASSLHLHPQSTEGGACQWTVGIG
ncbi:death ligand signal enhancer [Spinachia spinachia]